MVNEETTVEVRVFRLPVRLLKVVFPGGHHLVVGGRLVSSAKDGVKTPHPDLPPYGMEFFPVPFGEWGDGLHPEVRVEVFAGSGTGREASVVRASSLLFAAASVEAVKAFIRGGGR